MVIKRFKQVLKEAIALQPDEKERLEKVFDTYSAIPDRKKFRQYLAKALGECGLEGNVTYRPIGARAGDPTKKQAFQPLGFVGTELEALIQYDGESSNILVRIDVTSIGLEKVSKLLNLPLPLQVVDELTSTTCKDCQKHWCRDSALFSFVLTFACNLTGSCPEEEFPMIVDVAHLEYLEQEVPVREICLQTIKEVMIERNILVFNSETSAYTLGSRGQKLLVSSIKNALKVPDSDFESSTNVGKTIEEFRRRRSVEAENEAIERSKTEAELRLRTAEDDVARALKILEGKQAILTQCQEEFSRVSVTPLRDVPSVDGVFSRQILSHLSLENKNLLFKK